MVFGGFFRGRFKEAFSAFGQGRFWGVKMGGAVRPAPLLVQVGECCAKKWQKGLVLFFFAVVSLDIVTFKYYNILMTVNAPCRAQGGNYGIG